MAGGTDRSIRHENFAVKSTDFYRHRVMHCTHMRNICQVYTPGGGLGWVGLGQGLIRTSGTTDVALPCASQLVRWVLGCPVSRPTGLMTAPVPRGGTRGREMPPYLCVWGARAAGGCGAWTGWAARHVGSHGSAAPGPAPDQSVTQGGVPGLGSTPCSGLWGGGGALTYLCLPYTGTTRGRHGVSAAHH